MLFQCEIMVCIQEIISSPTGHMVPWITSQYSLSIYIQPLQSYTYLQYSSWHVMRSHTVRCIISVKCAWDFTEHCVLLGLWFGCSLTPP